MGDRLEGEEPWEIAARTAAQSSAGSRVEARTLTMPRRMRTPLLRPASPVTVRGPRVTGQHHFRPV
jgi:hypothetical protein